MKNVEVHEGRVEAWRPASLFAVVISRAFAELTEFVAACRHLLVAGGTLAAMKGKRPDRELKHLPPNVRCKSVIRLRTPQIDAERHLILCEVVG
jgi:16S rRNA (guanine527-N7)-methyltransferase